MERMSGSPEIVARLLEKHNLPVVEVRKGPHEGVVNSVWFAGDFVVRIVKNRDFESDVFTESVAVPAVVKAGCLTPNLLVFDNDRDIIDEIVTIYDRVTGISLMHSDSPANPEILWTEIGQRIREFHDRVTVVDDPDNLLDPAWTLNSIQLLEEKRDQIDPNVSESTKALLRRLPPYSPTERRFCHQDLHIDNILIHEGKLTAILDWGDAGWADPSVDFRYVPPRFFETVLQGYGELNAQTLANLAHHHLDQYLYCQVERKAYGPNGDSTWQEVVEGVETILERL